MQDNNVSIDQFFNSVSSPLNAPDKMPGLTFEHQFEVQTNKIKLSQFIGTSTIASATGTVGTAGYVFAQTNLVPTLKNGLKPTQFMNMAQPYVAVYEGTTNVGSMQIFPYVGNGITPNKFICQAGFDWQFWNGTTNSNPAQSYYTVTIYNNTGGTTANIYFVSQWKYLSNNAGKST